MGVSKILSIVNSDKMCNATSGFILHLYLVNDMNQALLRGILLVIISISLFLMITTDSPYPLATLGLAIVCWSLMPKLPRD